MTLVREIKFVERNDHLEGKTDIELKEIHSTDNDETWNEDINHFIDLIEAKQQREFVRETKAKKAGIELGSKIRNALISNPEKSRSIGESIGKAIAGRS